MQGKLNEIDIRSILQLIELGQRTGELFVEAYAPQMGSFGTPSKIAAREVKSSGSLTGQFWIVFFLNGQIIYAADTTDTHLSRLRDYLRRYKIDTALQHLKVSSIAAVNAPEYGYLWALLENHTLTPEQGRSIIHNMVHETLFDLLSLVQGSFIFEIGSALAPQLTTLEINPLVTKVMKQVQEWNHFHPHIQSPEQCPVIADAVQLGQVLPTHTFNTLEYWTDGKTSIRQIARYLNRDILTVARAIYPYVQQGLIHLSLPDAGEIGNNRREFEKFQQAKVPRVVCVDDSVSIGKAVENVLSQHGYEVSAIDNPLRALSLVFQLKPDLILCDIAMPELDGYEICAMLRKSTAFRQTPIVMLTGKDGFIDRLKARMVGATDYLTKPFGESELLMLVEKHVGSGNPESFQSNPLLSDVLEDELGVKVAKSPSTPSA
ncbi:MAG: response regulator [Scytolyngbya sp. HA4215-MV1]|jgi:twitching motility two-component system response regulator PilG|nr:response regulator [Scytolyngbya sp. HA4215-MV1]